MRRPNLDDDVDYFCDSRVEVLEYAQQAIEDQTAEAVAVLLFDATGRISGDFSRNLPSDLLYKSAQKIIEHAHKVKAEELEHGPVPLC